MTTLDDHDLFTETTATNLAAAPRKCRRHDWVSHLGGMDIRTVCRRCNAFRDEAAARRGRQSRNYGNRAELDVARTYGGRKVGHAGGPTDVAGATRKLQIKTLRRAVPAMWRSEFAKLDSERDGRLPILLLRFLRPGNVGPDDYFVIRGADFLEWYGKDGEKTP